MSDRDRDDDPVTIRDIYSLVQELNQRTATLVQQVTTLTERAQEDRSRTLDMASEMQKLKIKVYSVGAAMALLITMLTIVEKVSAISGAG